MITRDYLKPASSALVIGDHRSGLETLFHAHVVTGTNTHCQIVPVISNALLNEDPGPVTRANCGLCDHLVLENQSQTLGLEILSTSVLYTLGVILVSSPVFIVYKTFAK